MYNIIYIQILAKTRSTDKAWLLCTHYVYNVHTNAYINTNVLYMTTTLHNNIVTRYKVFARYNIG